MGGVAECPKMHGRAPTTEHDPPPNVSDAEAKEPWPGAQFSSLVQGPSPQGPAPTPPTSTGMARDSPLTPKKGVSGRQAAGTAPPSPSAGCPAGPRGPQRMWSQAAGRVCCYFGHLLVGSENQSPGSHLLAALPREKGPGLWTECRWDKRSGSHLREAGA